MIYNLCN